MNSLKHKLSSTSLQIVFGLRKRGQKAFALMLICLLSSFQTFATSDENFDLNVDLTIYPATCGENNGAITTTVSGGLAPYVYMWSNGQVSTGIVNLAPGDYSVTVTDALANTATASGTIIGYPAITISSVIVVEAHCGFADGWALVNVDGNPDDYNFDWSANVPTSNGPLASDLTSGTYSVTITDPSQPDDCVLIETFTVGNVDGPETTVVETAADCGQNNGSAIFAETAYDYTWNPDLGTANGNIRTDLPAGTYFVTITDPANPGCDNVKTVVIEEIPSITVDYTINSVPDCGIANGSVTINANGGSGNYNYSWGTQTVDNLAAGTYEVTVTDTDSGCTGSVIFTLVNSSGGAVVAVDEVIIACAGDMDGTVVYTVNYDPGFVFPADTIIQDANGNQYLNGSLTPGTYCVVIKDANGCFSGSDCFEIVAPTQIDADLAIVDETCDELGSITIDISGGAGGYTYSWSHDPNLQGSVANDLTEGIYSVTITDANGCSGVAENLLIGDDCQDDEPCILPIASVVVVEASCGNDDGFAIVNVVGDPDGDLFLYEWSSNIFAANNQAFSLTAGTYAVTVTDIDSNSPTFNCSVTEIFTVGNIDGPESDFTVTPAICGVDDGTVTFTEQTYQYTWDPDLGTAVNNYQRTDLPSGEYFITITDPSNPGCEDVITVVVEETSPLTVSATINTNPDCGVANGSATINVIGGTGDYTYSWGNQTQNDLEAGVYTVIVTDNVSGCTGTVTFSISVNNPQANVTINSIDSLLCSGDELATVNFTVNYDAGFALPADTLILDANGNTYQNGNLPAGSYCLVIIDANGCQQAGDCFEIENPSQIDVDVSIYPADCDSLGLITLAVTGGAGGYTFSWDPPILEGSTVDSLDPGTYSVTVSDANGCSVGAAQLVVNDDCFNDDPCLLSIANVVVIEASCGNTDGIAIVTVSGDPDGEIYDYTWSSNVGSFDKNKATNLSAGTYSVTIEDPTDPSCFLVETFTVGNIDGPESDYDVTSTICGVNDGTVTFVEQSFEYAWNPDLGTAISDYERIDLPGGAYFITITDPANPGCEDVITVVVEEDSPLDINPTVNSAPDCGSTNGSVTVNALGGSGDYTFDWGVLIGIGQTINDLAAGVYEVTVTDNVTGCLGVSTFSVNANNPLADLTINGIDTLLCSGDVNSSVDFTVNYDPGFAFPADTLIVDAFGNVYTNGDLPAGSYCVIINDANGCQQAGDCFEIENPNQIDVDISIYPAGCDEFGLITLEVIGGAGGYVYTWDPPLSPDATLDSLDPGVYTVFITDANGCSVGGAALIVNDTCPCPDIFLESVLVVEASCGNADGFAQVNVVGNPDDYIYTWSSNVASTDGPKAFNLEAGTYSVTIADIAHPDNCFIVEEFTVGNIDGPDVTYTTTPSDCSLNDGTVTFSNPVYEYSWSPDLGSGGTSNVRTDLPAGVYFVTVVDPAVPDCPDVVTVVVEQTGGLDVTATINQNPDCGQNNGSVTINASGGSGNYTYSWGGQTVTNLAEGTYEVTVTDDDSGCTGSVLFVLLSNDPQASVSINGVPTLSCAGDADGLVDFTVVYNGGFAFPADTIIQDAEGNIYTNGNLPSGSYCIVITDANGCYSGGDCFEIAEPNQIDVDVSIYPVDCDSLGAISVVATGGAGGFTYEWDPPLTNPSDSTASDLVSGIYGLTITDANGCSVETGSLIVDDECPCEVIIDGLLILNASCGNNDGFAFIAVDGGPGGFIYTWSPNVTNPAGPFALDLAAGTYSVVVTDSLNPNCFAVETFTVGNIDGPMVTYESTPSECGETNGTITLSNPAYEYAWDPDIGTAISNYERIDLPAGEYYITVTDPLVPECPNVITVIVDELEMLTVTATINVNPDCAQANGSATINVLGGSGDYTYSWGGPTVSNLETGVYSVSVTDNVTGCQGDIQFTIINNTATATITINSVSELLCTGDEDGTVDYSVIFDGGFEFPDSTVIVDALGNVQQNGALGPGSYCINVYDASGCLEASECFEIEAPTQINVVVEIENEICDSLGSITLVDVNGGAGGYTYEWDPSVTTDSLAMDLEPGIYGITVTDANGCSISGDIPIMADTNKITIDLMPDTLICDTSILLEYTIFPGSATVVWTDEDGNPIDPDIPVVPVDTSTYYVEVTSGDCFAMDSVIIIEGAINILVDYDSLSCVGSDSVITIINLDPGDTLTYNWGPDSLIVMDGNEHTGSPTINNGMTGDYSIYYDITNQYGCFVTDTLEFMVLDSIVVDTIVSTMQCDSTTVDFSVNESPFVIYVWNFGDSGNPGGAIGPNPSHTYSDTGCFTVTLIMLPNGSASCFQQDTIFHEVCVVEPPLFDLGVDVSVDCNDNGAEVTLEDISTSVLGDIIAWQWYVDGDSISSDSTVVIDVPQSDSLEVDLIVLNEEGCLDTLMEVIPINIIDIQFPDSILACEDDFIQIYNGSDSTWVFEWSPSGIFDDPNIPYAVAHITENVVITVSISDTMNLYSCSQADTIVVTVDDPISLMVLESDEVFCDAEDIPTSVTADCDNCDVNLIEWSLGQDSIGMGSQYPNNPQNPLEVGTYYAQFIDSITGCSDMDSVTFLLDPDFPLDVPDTSICFGEIAHLYVVDTTGIVSYEWEGNNILSPTTSFEIFATPSQTETYTLIVTNENGCTATYLPVVDVTNIGEVNASADTSQICIYESVQLNVNEIPGATYEWSNEETLDNPNVSDPVATPLETTTYDVTVTAEECSVVSSVTVTVVHPACEEPYVFFPNAFTPNGDGHNDELCLRGSDVTDVHFIIYNRWGEKMFESNSQGECWDGTFGGKKLGADVYGYYLQVRCGNGEEFIKKGNVTILK